MFPHFNLPTLVGNYFISWGNTPTHWGNTPTLVGKAPTHWGKCICTDKTRLVPTY